MMGSHADKRLASFLCVCVCIVMHVKCVGSIKDGWVGIDSVGYRVVGVGVDEALWDDVARKVLTYVVCGLKTVENWDGCGFGLLLGLLKLWTWLRLVQGR
ncbi:hypothetical protein BDP55DRAFT_658425 [Colletotrichum godetiae]|uniref:Transmembrane protein n=1 Tax=Colletotrichum godetiae TaxID=1209918 RepID=A0AAJ0F000_9PEZI|nr:uncharacterized protein BDP55DRAFT_658425 [Colletotrichum godetiae]KAK1688033.1 hypothetical protein BDP55DRAFT_658425 [Colletotrichum godetiae]